MPYCRDCSTEYTELLPWCPNCGTINVSEMDEWEDELMEDDELVTVFDADDEVEALLYRSMLEEAGIAVIERPMEEPWLEGVMQRALHSQLLVREEDAERAFALVDAFRREADEGVLSHELDEPQETDQTVESDDREADEYDDTGE